MPSAGPQTRRCAFPGSVTGLNGERLHGYDGMEDLGRFAYLVPGISDATDPSSHWMSQPEFNAQTCLNEKRPPRLTQGRGGVAEQDGIKLVVSFVVEVNYRDAFFFGSRPRRS